MNVICRIKSAPHDLEEKFSVGEMTDECIIYFLC